MLRHEDVSDDLEPQLTPKVSQAGKALVSETLGIIEARASIGALGHVMQMVEAVIVLELWHGKIISLQGRLHADKTRRHVGATRGGAADLEKQVCLHATLSKLGTHASAGRGSAALPCGKPAAFRPTAQAVSSSGRAGRLCLPARPEEIIQHARVSERRSLSAQQAAEPQVIAHRIACNLDKVTLHATHATF